jgi:FSR family fosmidomycin resistance protein-like MFS transporter
MSDARAGAIGAIPSPAQTALPQAGGLAMAILLSISFSHLLNDMIQSVLPAIYPILKRDFALNYGQIGLITLTFQMTASLLQPLVGMATDRRPRPFSLPIGMGATLVGLVLLSVAGSFPMLLLAAALVGLGSSVFHPEASRVARLASGGQHGLAQSVFQVGGNSGQAIGPLLAAFIVVPNGQGSVAWFTLAALTAMMVLTNVGRWYAAILAKTAPRVRRAAASAVGLSPARVRTAVAILVALMFSKFFYLASINSYFTFYLIGKFHVSVQTAQMHLFIFLAAAAAGTFIGGPLGDRIGRRYVIWGSILGVLPFTLALPFAGLWLTTVLTVVIGLILSSAFSAILVYAQELLPNRVGMIAGVFFGFAFGLGGIGAAGLGVLADATSINFVYQICAFLPAIGILAVFLPDMDRVRA